MNMKSKKQKTGVQEVVKPFIRGDAADENTVRDSLKFFGTMVVIILISFIACSSTAFGSTVLKLGLNLAVIGVQMMLYFNFGSNHGTEAVSRGEILYTKKEKNQEYSESERKLCFNPAKGFLTAALGTLLILIPALVLAFGTTLQTTDAGTLPSWMQAYASRSDIGNALVNYTQPEGMGTVDYLRAFIRICIIPYVNLIGHNNKEGMLLLERISPVIVMLPAVFYGFGYLTGKGVRTRIHTVISENDKNRIRKEKKRIMKQNRQSRRREPEQLN
ncbi:MAG: hypothetical protein J5841_03795 [Clostridia bacterium]|nr:hypothetical protein [Clostridia bacterium]